MRSARFLLVSLLVAGLFLPMVMPSQVALAQELGSPEDNACNPGGAMAGKCDTEWEWMCGWYMARFFSGAFTRAQVIAPCESLLPPLPPPSSDGAEVIFTICHNTGDIVCVSSNNTGTFDTGADGSIDEIMLFINAAIPAGCPATFAGKAYIGAGGSFVLVLLYGFTFTELVQLGLAPNGCSYA